MDHVSVMVLLEVRFVGEPVNEVTTGRRVAILGPTVKFNALACVASYMPDTIAGTRCAVTTWSLPVLFCTVTEREPEAAWSLLNAVVPQLSGAVLPERYTFTASLQSKVKLTPGMSVALQVKVSVLPFCMVVVAAVNAVTGSGTAVTETDTVLAPAS